MTDQPALFPPAYSEPVDPTSQVDRMPGTVAAPCLCGERSCCWPWCDWKEQADA